MDWLPLLTGAIVGALAGLLVQNIIFPELQARIRARRIRKLLRAANAAWAAFERLHPRLILVRGGWDKQGYFPEATVTMRLEAPPFVLREDLATEFREPHRREWEKAGSWDGEQIGIADYLARRISDEPEDDVAERDLHFELRVHKYQYFDRLATHHLLALTSRPNFVISQGVQHRMGLCPCSQRRAPSEFPCSASEVTSSF
jgi:hypothetical protein